MVLVRLNPWQEFNAIQRQLNRLLDESFVPAKELDRSFIRVPAAELQETSDTVSI